MARVQPYGAENPQIFLFIYPRSLRAQKIRAILPTASQSCAVFWRRSISYFTPVHALNMEFPGRWDVFPMEEYATAIARSPGKAGMEIMAQARANGRLVDHFKVTVN